MITIGRKVMPKTPEQKVTVLRNIAHAFRVVATILLLVNVGYLFSSNTSHPALMTIAATLFVAALVISFAEDRIKKS